ncbi:MAG TPA: TIGR01906 family membrane protein [Candidatus Lachnoclostridium stercoravium]|uniref:TIGR01906 family membrane protein n=1 Tax=Candidatus Lachnoclostridium stercoravium TaxID=2838633 RepID=A0A9D2KQ96_9FIRM|nr:TIGR01906 family membrane protein [Candidatus Lachnoclostridium stercoravium]
MKIFCNFLGVLCAFCLMFILLVTSVEAVVYWTPGYFEKEYTKYDVAAAVDMEMDDLLDVTDEMMAYLKGDREDLHVPTIVGGEEREFFNEREIAHMEDVQGLFLGAIFLRRLCVGIIAASIILLVLAKSDIKHLLPKMICIGTGLFFFLIAALSLIISTDFTKYFIIFHKIFFDNDLWILDPSTDLLINIVPEPFFMDTAFRIAGTFAGSVLAVFFLCIFLLRRQKKHSGM